MVIDGGAVVRSAVASDAPALGEVFDAAVLEGWTHLEHVEEIVPMFPPEFWVEAATETGPADVLLVAEIDGRVVGYSGTHGEAGELYVLFVHPAAGRRGIGRRLLAAAEEDLRARGRDEVFLWTHDADTRAQHVYAAAGYTPTGERRNGEIHGRHYVEVELRKPLAASDLVP
ncbi:N-acetylglutamate synthase, GNAT family [Rathayibacter oskolensis]|uniref:N-acetylglutamate synthase, GNAT family n=1 Tax=Rathayibacter oskolensis TaxID=1891671 RepID=A0A1X7NIU9_9MICO|nr:GNAT family N-acetyltransferase [Rathayibacter oskolensis]SMH37122.1 N-acetylglutamate synthase, GNAT family [Rathayibacter oskolensis]